MPTTSPKGSARNAPQDRFPTGIQAVLERVRGVLGSIVESVCGGSARAQDVTDGFGIHRKLGWQIWNVIHADDPLAAVKFMPNARGIQLFRKSAAQRNVPEDLLVPLDDVIPQFEQIIQTHAEDREMLEMLIEARDERPDEAAEIRWRKQSFTGNSFVWGVRAKTLLATVLLHPSGRNGYFDMVRIQGLLELVRTRSNVRWPFAQSITKSDDGTLHAPQRIPLSDSKLVRDIGVPLLEQFCSQPLPPVQRRPNEFGAVEDELLPGPVGQTGASTIITGEILREVAPLEPTSDGEMALWGTGIRTPGELLITDHFVHRDLFPGVTRELCVFGELISPMTQDNRDLLPVSESLQELGRGIDRVRTAEVPRYADILKFVFERTGWKADDFEVYRVRMRYPPIPISVMVRHELPRRS